MLIRLGALGHGPVLRRIQPVEPPKHVDVTETIQAVKRGAVSRENFENKAVFPGVDSSDLGQFEFGFHQLPPNRIEWCQTGTQTELA
jgi:hypothetical protein